MAHFQFQAIDPKGKKINGIREASDSNTLFEELKKEQLTVISIDPYKPGILSYIRYLKEQIEKNVLFASEPITLKSIFSSRNPSLDEVTIITRQMATLLNAGITLKDAFRIVIASSDKMNKMRHILQKIDKMIQEGIRFEVALKKFPSVFSAKYVSLVSLGMDSGRLHETLTTLSSDLERENNLRKRVYAALTYPMFTFVFSLLMNSIIFLYIFPKIIGILEELKVKLPLITVFMISIVQILTNPWYLALVIVLVIFLYLQFRYYIQTPIGKYNYDRLKLHIPIFGSINRIIFVERFGRSLSLLFKYGIPLQEAISITSKACANDFLVDCLFDVMIREISDGRELVEILRENPYVPSHVTHMIAAGIASGDLVQPLEHISNYFELELDSSLQRLVTLIEPMMIVIMSFVILATIISIMLPLYHVIMRLGA